MINPAAFWLGANPDGWIVDDNAESNYRLIEIKCPECKKNCMSTEALLDPNFYVHLVDSKPTLKKEHSLGYSSQVQFQLGTNHLIFTGGYQKMTKKLFAGGRSWKKIVCKWFVQKKFVCMVILKNLRISKYQTVAKMPFCCN